MDITKLIDNVFDVSERDSFYAEDNAYTCDDDREQFSKQRSDARLLKAEITRLREDNKRMRDALEAIARGDIPDYEFGTCADAALATTGGEVSKPAPETWIGKKVSDITDMKDGDVVWEDENGIVTRSMSGGGR